MNNHFSSARAHILIVATIFSALVFFSPLSHVFGLTIGGAPEYCQGVIGNPKSNIPTRWTITGPEPISGISPPRFPIAYLSPCGLYTLEPDEVKGYAVATISPASTQFLGAERHIYFTITYVPVGEDDCIPLESCPPDEPFSPAELTVNPPSRSVAVGDSTGFYALYIPPSGGPLPDNFRAGQGRVEWTAISGTGAATFTGVDGLGRASFRGDRVGQVTIQAEVFGLMDDALLTVTPALTLDASLRAIPASGTPPFLPNLIADVGGTALGTINYNFWWDCAYSGNILAVAISQCGVPNAKFDGLSSETKTVSASYFSSGSYTPLVIVERAALSAYAKSLVVVTSTKITGTHSECVANACIQVAGAGPDRCGENADCGSGGPGGPDVHSVCDAVNKACVNEEGSGANQCAGDPVCGGSVSVPPQTHLECQNDACLIVGGFGVNECAAVGRGCTSIGPPSGGEGTCTFKAMPSVIKKGESSSVVWACEGELTSCAVRDSKSILVKQGGINGEAQVKPLETTTYTLTCGGVGGGKYVVRTTTVYVSRLEEVPPQ